MGSGVEAAKAGCGCMDETGKGGENGKLVVAFL
jgi:hypothetical protein